MKTTVYDEDYFERGIQTGKSCYVDYRWIPELTIPMTMTIIDFIGIKRGESILDYGCAKGYSVKAFNMLGRNGYGFDISEYAVSHSPLDVRNKIITELSALKLKEFDYMVAKDVFEHMKEKNIVELLSNIKIRNKVFVVVPLGDNNNFRVPAYELDKTHITAKNEDWWNNLFMYSGWFVKDFRYLISGIKDNWKEFATGNGFFLLERK